MYIFKKSANNTNKHLNEELKNMLDRIALIILVIGGLNWGSIGLFQFDLVSFIFGGQSAVLSRIIYTLVALSAIWCVSLMFRENELIGETSHDE